MNEKQLREIEARAKIYEFLAWADGAIATEDIPALLHEVRRLRAVVEEYANHDNWLPTLYHDKCNGWQPNESGYTRAENALKDGE